MARNGNVSWVGRGIAVLILQGALVPVALAAPANFYTVLPCRVFDSRLPGNGPALSSGVIRTINVAGVCGVPANATSVTVNLAVTQPTSIGFLRVFASGPVPSTFNNLNYSAQQTRANNGFVQLSPGGQVDALVSMPVPGTLHLILDVFGYFLDDAPPTAQDDSDTVTEDASATTIDVLANDTDSDGGPISVSSVTQPANGTVVITNGGADLTYQPDPDTCNAPPGTTPDTFTYTVLPGGSTANVSMTVNCVNDAPVLGSAGTVAFAEGGPPVLVAPALTVADVDDVNLESAVVMISNLLDSGFETLAVDTTGTSITASYSAPNLTLTGTDSVANYELVLRRVTYENTSANPDSVARFVAFVANDGSVDGNAALATVLVVSANDAPVLTAGGGSPTFTEDGGAVAVDPGLTVADPDDVNLESATVTIANLLDVGAEALAASTAGTSIVASYTAPTLTLTGSDTLARYQQVLRSVTYANTSQNPNATPRTIAFTANDGTAASNTVTKALTVTPVNDAPVLTAGGASPTFTEDGPPAVVDPGLTATDLDDTNLESATVTITNLLNVGAEALTANTTGTSIVASYAAPTLTLTGSDTLANYQAVLRRVTYANTSQNPSTTARSIAFVANDGTANSNTATTSVGVTTVNDAPVLTAGGGSPTFTENGPPVPVDPALVVTDVDDVNLESATVTITNLLDAGLEMLAATTGGTSITATYTAPTLTLTGTDTRANYQAVLRSVTYFSSSQNPNTTPRTLQFVANDGTANSNTVATTLNVLSLNDGPVLTPGGGSPTFTEDGAAVVVDNGLTVTDVNDTNLESATVTITNLLNAGAETLAASTAGTSIVASYAAPMLTLTGSDTLAHYQAVLRSATYANTSQNPNTIARSLAFRANDGTDLSNVVTKLLTVVAVNDAPAVAGTGTVAFTEDAGAVGVASGLLVTDVDNTTLASATVTITNVLNAGFEVLTANTGATAIVANYVAPTLTLTGADSLAAYQAVLRTVAYNNGSNAPNPTPRSVAFTVNDGSVNSNTALATVQMVPVNDPPILTTNPITYATVGNTQLHVAGDTLPGVASIADPQGALTKSSPTDVDGPVAPSVVAASGPSANGGSFTIDTDGSFTYVPPLGFTGTDSFTYQVTDGLVSVIGTVDVSVSSVVWYVRDVTDANNPAGGNGRSTNAFETLAAAQAASGNNHFIFVFEGNTATTPLAGGIVLKDGQKLYGEGVGLSVPGFPNIVAAGNQPRINNAAGDAVSVPATAGNRNGVEIRGLDLQGSANAIDVTASGTNAVNVTITSNNIRLAGEEGIDLNAGASALFTAIVQSNTIVAIGNGFDARTSAPGQLRVDFSTNTVFSLSNAVVIDGSGGGSTIITGFASNVVNANTVAAGIVVNVATFDATPGLPPFDPVSGGNTALGVPGNGMGGAGMVLTSISGNLAFTDLDVFADGGVGLRVIGTGAFTGSAGTQVSVGAGVSTIAAVAGPAVDLASMTANLPLVSLSSLSSVTTGVSLVNVAGTFSAPSGSITTAAATAFVINGGTATVTYGGSITDSVGLLISVANATGGTKTFSGAITYGNSGIGSGVSLTNNTGATINFQGGLVLSTGANPAFTATGGGTVNVCDENPCAPTTGALVNTITTTTATAVNVSGTTIGASGLTFRSVSTGTAASGPTNGIVLNTTGSAGGLTVTGTGSAGSGGTIQKASGDGVSLTSTSHVSLAGMIITGNLGNGILGAGVSDFTLADSTVASNGDSSVANEGGLNFTQLLGVVNLTNVDLGNNFEDNARIINSSGTLSQLTITGSSIHDTSAGSPGNDGLLLQADGTANITADISTTNFTRNRANGLQVINNGSGNVDVEVGTLGVANSGGRHDGNNIALNMAQNGTGSSTFNFAIRNTDASQSVKPDAASAIDINLAASSQAATTMTGTIQNCIVDNNNSSTGPGIRVVGDGGGTLGIAIQGCTVTEVGNFGIQVLAGHGSNTVNARIAGNTVTLNNAQAGEGIRVDSAATGSDTTKVCLDIAGNTATSGGGNPFGIRVRQRFSNSRFILEGYAGAGTDDVAVATFIDNNNVPATTTVTADHFSATGFETIASCPTP